MTHGFHKAEAGGILFVTRLEPRAGGRKPKDFDFVKDLAENDLINLTIFI